MLHQSRPTPVLAEWGPPRHSGLVGRVGASLSTAPRLGTEWWGGGVPRASSRIGVWQGVRPLLSGQLPLEQTPQVTSNEVAEAPSTQVCLLTTV